MSSDASDAVIGAELGTRIEQISAALDLAGARIPAEVVDRARADLAQVAKRVELGVDYTVVALVGGTGSGKSSLFNAFSKLQFADVGVIRPTTSQAAACVWGSKASQLLDFLQIGETRRIQRESALDGDDEGSLSGLVLLDLPDHDSVAEGHAELVNRLLPLIDLLVWVVDPQKYADNVLHEEYLKALASRHEAMLVVVNQVDTLQDAAHTRVREDVARLLVQDGLADVPILLASARTGAGISEIRDHVRHVLAGESVGARTARAELAAVAGRVGAHLGAADPEIPDVGATAEEISLASGVPSVAESVRSAVSSPRNVVLSAVHPPARSRTDAIRQRWLAAATGGLPQKWTSSVTSGVVAPEAFADHVRDALGAVPLPAAADDAAARLRMFGFSVCGVGIALVVAALLLLPSGSSAAVWLGAGGLLALIVGAVLVFSARSRRMRTAVDRSESYLAAVTAELSAVVRSDFVEPTAVPLAEHARVRAGVAGR